MLRDARRRGRVHPDPPCRRRATWGARAWRWPACGLRCVPDAPAIVVRLMGSSPTGTARAHPVLRRSLLIAALVLVAGCGTTIVPPADPPQPVNVFILDHGRTPSLVLPAPDGGMTRYAYGDWNWYALRNTGVWDGVRALFWPTPGTLGRQPLEGPPTAQGLRERLGPEAYAEIVPVTVGRAEVERLRGRLDEAHRAGARRALVETLGLQFVPYPQPYTYLGNSNHAVAAWLRDLGCETRGLSLHSRWRVAPE
jgi:hypothetical protein